MYQGSEVAIPVLTNYVEHTAEDIVTESAVGGKTDQLSFLVAKDGNVVFQIDKLNEALIGGSDGDSFLEGIEVILERDQLGGFHGFNHEGADLLFFHFGSPDNKLPITPRGCYRLILLYIFIFEIDANTPHA